MFYEFHQNNSYGIFTHSMGMNVVIEADSAKEANRIAEDYGIYFDGCDDGIDCPCCGDRWNRVSESDATEVPQYYHHVLHDNSFKSSSDFGFEEGKIHRIIYKDGKEEWM